MEKCSDLGIESAHLIVESAILDTMTFRTKIFNQIYEQAYLKGVNPEEEIELSRVMMYFLYNVKLDNDVLLEQIIKEEIYKLRINKKIEELSDKEKNELIQEHLNFIEDSCKTVIN